MPHLPLMDWNYKDELVAVSRQQGANPEITYYQYDSQGRRLRKVTEYQGSGPPPGQKDQRIYLEGYEYYENFNSGEQIHSLSLKDERQRFVMVEKTNIPGHHLLVRYLHDSHQGSCTLETDESGNVITYEEYHPFGTSSYQATNAGILSSSKRYRYVGKKRDEESGLYYYGARFYAPWLCRFMSCYPKAAQFPDQSPYNYWFNNPINLIDPEGPDDPPTGSESNPILLDEVEVTATRTYPSVAATYATSPGDSKFQKGACENCKVIGLEDGDYFSDVQNQIYTATFSGVTKDDFGNLKTLFITDPGNINDNALADYELIDRDGSGGVSIKDHIDIDILGPDNGSVMVQDVAANNTGFMAKFATLEGHTDAGWMFFGATYDEKAGQLTVKINNTARTNSDASLLGGPLVSRAAQQEQWKIVLSNVGDILGEKPISASMTITEYDYNDFTNQMATTPEWAETQDIKKQL
jgi:RHS repeat-associated protein